MFSKHLSYELGPLRLKPLPSLDSSWPVKEFQQKGRWERVAICKTKVFFWLKKKGIRWVSLRQRQANPVADTTHKPAHFTMVHLDYKSTKAGKSSHGVLLLEPLDTTYLQTSNIYDGCIIICFIFSSFHPHTFGTHTSYLSFFLHSHIFCPENFTLKSEWIYDKKGLATKQHKFATQIALRQNSIKLHTVCILLNAL